MKVFVLGAGVSCGAGFPLSSKLYPSLKDFLIEKSRDDLDKNEILEKWEALERKGIFVKVSDIETNLTRLDIQINKEKDLIDFRTAVGDILTEYFNEKHKSISSVDYLSQFADRWIQAGDVILTFNYDCLIERVLHKWGLWSIEDGYGFQVNLTNGGHAKVNMGNTKCVILKLHGSVGWVSSVIDSGFFIQDEALASCGYPGMHDAGYRHFGGSRTMILPSYIKMMTTYPLPLIWRQAAESLQKAKKVFFFGYSFPKADSAAWMLFLSNISKEAEVHYCWYPDFDFNTINRIVNALKWATPRVYDYKCSIEEAAKNPGQILKDSFGLDL